MKKFFRALLLAVICLPLLQGCLKDSCRNTYTFYRPVLQKLSEVRAGMKSSTPRALQATGKIYVYGQYIFLNETGKGIHVIDNTNPAQPRNISFINIPGNVDMAVKGTYLYADSYSDIAVFNIANPVSIATPRFLNNVLKDYGYYWGNHTSPDSVMIVVGYERKDTTVDCETYQRWMNCSTCLYADAGGGRPMTVSPGGSAPQGIAGSMARFSIVNDYLYGVSTSKLYTFSLSDPSLPQQTSTKNMPWGIETIYPFQQSLFIGSTSGMFIYDITNPSDPAPRGSFSHARSCDPVITDGQHAYVTLRSGNACAGFTNQLDVLNVANLSQPSLVKSYALSNPHGLAKDGSTLFVCDGASGLKVYDAADPLEHRLLRTIEGMEAYDVIAYNGLAIVVAKDGLYQYDYSNLSSIRLLSKTGISK